MNRMGFMIVAILTMAILVGGVAFSAVAEAKKSYKANVSVFIDGSTGCWDKVKFKLQDAKGKTLATKTVKQVEEPDDYPAHFASTTLKFDGSKVNTKQIKFSYLIDGDTYAYAYKDFSKSKKTYNWETKNYNHGDCPLYQYRGELPEIHPS